MMTDLPELAWRKSTRSGMGDCVEVANKHPGLVAVRDSKDPAGPALTFSPAAWRSFITQLRER